MNKILLYSFWISVGFFTWLLLLISLQYIPVKYDVAFLLTKSEAIVHTHYKIAFFTHVFTSIFTIVLGFFLFSEKIRKHKIQLHRFLGKVYVIIVLLFAGTSGLVMSLYANGGLSAKISFTVLSILWLWFTYKAYRYAVHKKIKLHQQFMIRSYALTLSAITLRLFKYIIANTLELPPMDTYRIVAWLSWTINILIAEYLIYRKFGMKMI